jgi:hypothetical protein
VNAVIAVCTFNLLLAAKAVDITTSHAAGAATPTAAHLRRLDQPWLEVRHTHCRLLLQAVAAPQSLKLWA